LAGPDDSIGSHTSDFKLRVTARDDLIGAARADNIGSRTEGAPEFAIAIRNWSIRWRRNFTTVEEFANGNKAGDSVEGCNMIVMVVRREDVVERGRCARAEIADVLGDPLAGRAR